MSEPEYLATEAEVGVMIDRRLSEMFPDLYKKPEPVQDSLERIEADYPELFGNQKRTG
jgi:hypothetical protein